MDSILQHNPTDPIWHNHYLSLAQSSACGQNNLEVKQITLESPGQIFVAGSHLILTDLPVPTFTGKNALNGTKITISPGTDVKDVVSFKLLPLFSGNTLTHVCVTDIKSANTVIHN